MKLSEVMNSLIADEWIASVKYKMLAFSCKGKAKDAVDKKLFEIADEEYNDHYTKLVTWSRNHGFKLITDPIELIRVANDKFPEFSDGLSTKEAVDIVIKAEVGAINAYTKYIKAVNKLYPDLVAMFTELLSDEKKHKAEMTDLLSQV